MNVSWLGDFSGSFLHFIGLVERLLVITREQHGQLVGIYPVALDTAGKLIHLAVKEYIERFGTPIMANSVTQSFDTVIQ